MEPIDHSSERCHERHHERHHQGLAAHSLAQNLSAIAPGAGAQPSLHSLRIDWSEVEQRCGLEANDLWVGSLWAGAYRLGVLRRSPLSVLVTELLVIALAGMVSLPLGLLLVRNPAGADPETARAAVPFAITVASGMVTMLLLRYRCLGQNRKRWRSLLGILDELDRYHDTLRAVEFLDQLQEIHSPSQPISLFKPGIKPGMDFENVDTTQSASDPATFKALSLTRDSLVTGLCADYLLRQQQSMQNGRVRKTSAWQLPRKFASPSGYVDLLEHLDQNLATLTAFEVSQQASEEAQLLNEALQISVAVRHSLS